MLHGYSARTIGPPRGAGEGESGRTNCRIMPHYMPESFLILFFSASSGAAHGGHATRY